MEIAWGLVILLSVAFGFLLGRLPVSRRRVSDELRHRPDPTTQVATAEEAPEGILVDDSETWIYTVVIPVRLDELTPDEILRLAGFSIWSRPSNGSPTWMDHGTPHRDVYPQSVALKIAIDRIVVRLGV